VYIKNKLERNRMKFTDKYPEAQSGAPLKCLLNDVRDA